MMGTNYYAKKNKRHEIPCPNCGCQIFIPVGYEEFHIGKSSFGYKFLFASNDKFDSWETFKVFIEKDIIKGDWWIEDEYGEKADTLDFISLIALKQTDRDQEQCENRNGYNFMEGDFA